MPFIIGALIGVMIMSLLASLIAARLKMIFYAFTVTCSALVIILPAMCKILWKILRYIGNLSIRHYAYREKAYTLKNSK